MVPISSWRPVLRMTVSMRPADSSVIEPASSFSGVMIRRSRATMATLNAARATSTIAATQNTADHTALVTEALS